MGDIVTATGIALALPPAVTAAATSPLVMPTTTVAPLTISESPSVVNDNLLPFSTPVEPTAYPRCSSNLDSAFVDILLRDQKTRDTRRVEDARRHESER